MRVGIVGTGGVGGLLGGLLARQGTEVALLARGAHARALREHGLHVQGTIGELTVMPAAVAERGSELGVCDVVFVAVKTWQLGGVVADVRAMVGESTVAIGRANGVALAADAVARRLAIIDGLAHDATISMQRDLMAGRPSELGEQSVSLRALARSLGVATPVHDVCVPLLALQEAAARAGGR